MAKRSSHTSSLAATILVLFNFFIMIFCLLAFAISLWAIASPSSLLYVIQVFGSPALKALITEDSMSVQLGLSGAMFSAFFFCICMMGFYGAVTGSQFLLFMYASLVILLLLLECALMYYFSSTIVEKGIQDDGQWTHALRLSLECCDKNYTTIAEPVKPVWSCCGAGVFPKNCTVEKVFKKDCQQAVINWLQKYQIIIYVSLAVFHLTLSSCSLIRRSLSGSHSHSLASS